MLTIFAGLAQLERRIISKRTKAVLRAKKLGAKSSAAPFSLTPSQVREARVMVAEGKGSKYVARLFGVDPATLYRALKKVAA